MTPVSYIEAVLPEDMRSIRVLGVDHDLRELVRIPRASEADLDDVLHDHVERTMTWKKILALLKNEANDASDALDTQKNKLFNAYYLNLENSEREELARCVHDEESIQRDEWRRIKHVRDRMSSTPERMVKVRWRRNFTDDRVWSLVRSDDTYVEHLTALRKARRKVSVVEAVVDALEHRMRCLSHLCARARLNAS